MTRIVFMGTPEFAVPSLKALIDNSKANDYQIIGVFTQPDRPKGRGNKIIQSPIKELAMEYNIPVFQPGRIRRDGLQDLTNLKPDLCVTAAFGQILSKEILEVPQMGTINVHASLLPKHRGSAPINWAILMGEKKTGITTMLTDVGIDTGDMLLQKEISILPGETAGELSVRLAQLGAEILINTIELYKQNNITPTPQDDSQHSYEPMLKKQMGLIDWDRPIDAIINQIRGLNPWPCAHTETSQGVLKIWRAERVQGAGKPGEVIVCDSKKGLILAGKDGGVRLCQIQAPNKKQMQDIEYVRGNPFAIGEVFGGESSER